MLRVLSRGTPATVRLRIAPVTRKDQRALARMWPNTLLERLIRGSTL